MLPRRLATTILWFGIMLLLAGCSPESVSLPAVVTPPSDAAETSNPPVRLSPGPKIAFQSNRDGNWEIYIMDVDGSNSMNLTRNQANDHSPAWSPDGQLLAFCSDRQGQWDIYTMRADGSSVVQLSEDPAVERHPTWSPDGKRIAFMSDREGGWEVFAMNSDGSGVNQLTSTGTHNGSLDWSPDGERLAFYTEPEHYHSHLNAVQADGSSVSRITWTSSYHDMHPSWSPDGTQIAYASEKNGHLRFEIYVLDLEMKGSEPRQLTDLGARAWNPDWSPDGRTIVFTHAPKDEDRDIYGMDADGSNLTQLTHSDSEDDYPRWSPVAPVSVD
jgi:Tol biopolymer transport system component